MILLFFFLLIFTSQGLLLSSSAPTFQPSKTFLKEVLNAVAAKKQWDPEANPRVSAVEIDSVRIGAIQTVEFYVRVGVTTVILKFSDEIESWRKADEGEVEFAPDSVGFDASFRQGINLLSLEGPLELHANGDDEGEVEFAPDSVGFDASFRQGINLLSLEGPLELHANGDDDLLSVHLPSLNITHQGLRRVLVGEGITIELYSYDEVSLFYPYDISFLMNESSSKHKKSRGHFWPLGLHSCAPLVSVRVVGPASLVAFRVPDEKAHVETSFSSHDTIELMLNKSFSNDPHEPVQSVFSHILSSKFAVMERLLNGFLGTINFHDRSSRLSKLRITSSKLLKFRAEVERNITENDRAWKDVAKWRTRPTVERSWFEIVGRFEGDRGLKPVIARMLSRPLVVVESAAWSHLMSNISFSEFPSIIVPPEALMLDIKW